MHPLPIDYERLLQEAYEAFLSPGDIVVDVGAHLGRHTVPLSRCVSPGGQVFAVEPLPACRERLQQTLREHPDLAGTIALLSQALSDQPGQADFVSAEDLPAFSGLKEVRYPAPTRLCRIPVTVTTLDELFADLPALRFVKVDAEGAELHILRGGQRCLARFRPVVSFEFGTLSNQQYQVAPQDMARFWQAQEYHVYAITGECLGEEEFIQRAEARDLWDYLAVPEEAGELNRTIRQALCRPRVNWLAVRAELNHARDHAPVGAALPPLRRFRGPLWPLAQLAARLFLLAARTITVPQRFFNRALLLALEHLLDGLEQSERQGREQDRRLRELEQRLADLEAQRTPDLARRN
jgi:FkbM family methyltransferase